MQTSSGRFSGFVIGVLFTLAVEALVAVLVVWTGAVPVAATASNRFADRVLGYASMRSIRHHATAEANPVARDPAALKVGLEHYREMCVDCHGGPGAEPEEFAAGLHPPAPDLASPAVRRFTDGMLYTTIADGIGSTGMPAFRKTHTPKQIWSIVAFVRHLPALTPEEKRELQKKETGEGEGEGKPSEGAPTPSPEQGEAPVPGSGGGAGTGAAQVHQVTLSNSHFQPATLELRAGDTVVWNNTDFIDHTATADDGSFDTGKIEGGKSKRTVLRKKGTIAYHCRYHSGMTGKLIVR